MRYLSKSADPHGCVFCDKLASEDDVDNLVVWRGASIAIVMNLYPYSTGHLMLMPYEHVASPEDLSDPRAMSELALEIGPAMRAVRRVLRCQGFNTGMNTGSVAGAGIADHMHMHLVPRWSGDANFMPIIANVTVMPEALSVTYAKLRAELMVERDPDRSLEALVFSSELGSVLLVESRLPAVSVRTGQTLVASMSDVLAALGAEATVAGWAGGHTVVWRASHSERLTSGQWVTLGELPESIALLANDALARLQAPNS